MSNFKERMMAKMEKNGMTASQFLDHLTAMFIESIEHMTDEELRKDLEEQGVDVDASLERTEKILNKYGISMKVLFTGKVDSTLLSFGKPLTPQRLDVSTPIDEARPIRKRYCGKCRWHQSGGGFGDEANIQEECNAILGKHDDYATDGIVDRIKEHPNVLNANNDCTYYNSNWFGWRGY